jgi:hypothetical protein
LRKLCWDPWGSSRQDGFDKTPGASAHADVVRLLLDAPAHAARALYDEQTPRVSGHAEVVRLLLAHAARADDLCDEQTPHGSDLNVEEHRSAVVREPGECAACQGEVACQRGGH